LWVGVAGVAPSACAIDFLHIAANVGGSSGGHAALRVGDTVYHFVHEPPGILRLERTAWARFDYQYRVLENRAMVVHRIPATGGTEAAITRDFEPRVRAAAQAPETAHALTAAGRFAGAVTRGKAADGPEPDIELPAVGLFSMSGQEEQPALAAVRDGLAPAWQEERRRARAEVLQRVPERVLAADIPGDPVDRVAPPYYRPVRRGLDGRMNEAADDILRTARPLDDAALRTCPADECRLGVDEAERLAGFRAELERGIVRLLRSTRPDAGTALVLRMARLAAVDRSLRAGRWAVLDGYGAAGVTLTPDDTERRRD